MTRDEYYTLLDEKHKQTDWNNRESRWRRNRNEKEL